MSNAAANDVRMRKVSGEESAFCRTRMAGNPRPSVSIFMIVRGKKIPLRTKRGQTPLNRLGQQFLDDFAIVDNFDRAITRSHQFLVRDNSHAMVDGGEQVFGAHRQFFRFRCRGV